MNAAVRGWPPNSPVSMFNYHTLLKLLRVKYNYAAFCQMFYAVTARARHPRPSALKTAILLLPLYCIASNYNHVNEITAFSIIAFHLLLILGGARLGLPSTATLVVAANDEPHGLLSIRSYPSMASSLNVEESTRYIRVVVRRRGGALGTISLQYQTKDGSAISIPGNQMRLAFDQVLDTTSAERFHSFKAYGTEYLLLASSFRKGKVGHTITGTAPNSPYQSTLFRWQGTFVPVFVSSYTLDI